MTPQLCLGTAQFGLPYGITNAAGQVSEEVVLQLLTQAQTRGVRWLDTAQAYGNAEAVLGRCLPDNHSFRLISKLSGQPQSFFTPQDVLRWDHSFCVSCEQLGLETLDGLLLHDVADLRKPGGEYLAGWLLGLRQRGLVRRLGVSIYSAEDLEGVNSSLLDMVQLPLSLFDQRLLQDGTVSRLRSNGTAIQARSVFLQGLLLTPVEQWPAWAGSKVRAHQQALEGMARQRGCLLMDLALGFVKEQPDLEAVVVGLCSVKDFNEIMASWDSNSPWMEQEWLTWALHSSSILDPRLWPH